jgi:hypothetical protein
MAVSNAAFPNVGELTVFALAAAIRSIANF